MYFFIPYYNPNNFYRNNPIHSCFETLTQALALLEEAIHNKKEQEFLYDFLISVAPTEEEKNIIDTIREDERNNSKSFRKIYKLYTGQSVYSQPNGNFEKPKSYIDGINRAKFDELNSIEMYRNIISGIPNEYHKDIIYKILTNELNHNHKYNYILNLYLMKCRDTTSSSKTKFTTENALKIAKDLGIDFSKESFDLNQFIIGLNTELEHSKKYYPTNITKDDPLTTEKVALAHLREFPDYYTRLSKLKEEANAYWSTVRNYCRQTKDFTLDELAQYDGTMGKPAYVAVNGIVYDVTNISKWSGGTHYGLTAGKDLSSQFDTCHGASSKLKKLPKVGILK